ncbi:AAWKG family protein [Streptomyces sp. NPDC019224]|uniref:AAWKG family protein n=1 Tax=Streptomyces sp. NPDC019224 TaxID=3154484 RepID=UPI0033F4DDDB
MAADSSWESVVKQLTGFDGGTRVNVAAVGGADAAAGDGSEWMQPGISHGEVARETTPDLESPGAKLGRTLKFYGPPESSSGNVQVYTVQLVLPWESSNGADWSDTGNAGAYDWGYGQALRMLVDEHRTTGFGAEYPHTKAVADEDSVDLRTFPATARAFDRVTAYFRGRSPVLDQWVKDLDGEDAAYRGSGADVFRDLIDALGTGYKDLLSDLSSTGGGSVSVSDPSYRPDSVVSDRILDAELAIFNAASTLWQAWDSWVATGMWLGTAHLDKLLDEVALWLNENNIRRMQQNEGGASRAGAGFLTTHPVYGDLTKEESWKALSRAACTAWTATLSALDTAAQRAMLDLNQAMMVPGTATGFTFTPGSASLSEANASDEAAKAKEEAQKQMDDLAKGVPGTGDPGTGAPGLGDDGGAGTENPFATGDEESVTGPGGDGTTPSAVPPLGLNGTGDGSSFGLDGTTTANPDGSVTTTNPDGSLTTTNPDGSRTTTYPDGHQETTPAGVLPPVLGLNGTSTPGLGGATARTVKGPDGSTTTYNPDGSRTIAHKDGTTTTVRADGSTVTDNPDGSRTVLNKDGSETVTYRDGTKTTIAADGSTSTRYPDGTSAKLSADGTLTATDAQGHSTVTHPRPGAATHNPDGSTTTYGEDGTTTTTHADGTKTTVAANGTVTTVDPDGTKTVSHLGKGTSTVQYADGSVAQVGADGTVSTTYKDGSTTKLGPDGTYTTSDAYGQTTGTESAPGANGSGWADDDYYDYPDSSASASLLDGGYGSAADGDGTAGGQLPPLGLNPLGGQGLTPGATGAGALGERSRSLAVGEAASARGTRAAQLAAEEAAAMRRPATSSSGTPMMPPMGGMGGGAGAGTQSAERERSTWVSEDEETWGTDEGGVSAVIGR